MYKIGLSTKKKEVNEELFKQYAAAGIKAMELVLSEWEPLPLSFAEYKELSDKYGVEIISAHFPCDRADIADESVFDYTLKTLTDVIKEASEAGIHRFVAHAGSDEDNETCEARHKRLKTAKKMLNLLAEYAAEFNSVIAVETLPRGCIGRDIDEISVLLGVNDKLKVCLDVNHIFRDDLSELVRKFGKRIVTTHISDYDFVYERHWMPGEGLIDWDRLIETLKEIGYDGPWLYEVGFDYSSKLGRRYNCNDFIDNVNKILAPHFL